MFHRLGANPRLCFEKYVDVSIFLYSLYFSPEFSALQAIIDLLLPGSSPGIKERLIDLYGKPEILFFGPDEGTADMMDWAASTHASSFLDNFDSNCSLVHARSRGAPWWKSFTTGKSAEKLGGVPHDTYGMTSLSVRQYIIGCYNNLNLVEPEITKVQTGGPDGDLGSSK